ncbi:MAG: hypothetical protein Q9200_002539 [Gallowayella weberi]
MLRLPSLPIHYSLGSCAVCHTISKPSTTYKIQIKNQSDFCQSVEQRKSYTGLFREIFAFRALAKHREWQPLRGTHVSTRNPSIELAQYRHHLDSINNRYADDDQTSSVTLFKAFRQLAQPPSPSSSSQALRGARNLHQTGPPEEKFKDRETVLSDYNRNLNSVLGQASISSDCIGQCITELVDDSLPSANKSLNLAGTNKLLSPAGDNRASRAVAEGLPSGNNRSFRLIQLTWSTNNIRQSLGKLRSLNPFSAILYRRYSDCYSAYKTLVPASEWLNKAIRNGWSSSDSLLLESPSSQYLIVTPREEQRLESAYTGNHVGFGSKSDEPAQKEVEDIQSPACRFVENSVDAIQQGPLSLRPSSPAFPAFRFLENLATRVTAGQSTMATFHTSSRTTEPSPMPTRSVESNEVLELKEENLSDDNGMGSRPVGGPLGYHIPSDKMRARMLASRSSRSAYWQYALYEGPEGEKVKVHYCQSLETAERIAQLFLNESVIGFDIEWKPSATLKDGIRKNISLIQFASEKRIALFHIARFSKDDTIESLVAPTIKAIMESASITKVGVSVKADCSRLRSHMDINSHGLFELSQLYKLVKFSTSDVKKIDNRLVALARQVEEHLMLPMYKNSSVRGSDWSQGLNYEQIYYAASDSYAGFQLYHVLNSKRLALSPTPPLPAHAELGLPIRLANGQTVADYKELPPEEPSSDDEERAITPLPSTEGIAEDVLNLQIEDTNPSPRTARTLEKDPPNPKPSASLSSHPSVVAAFAWAARYRASASNNPSTTNPSSSSSNDATYPSLPPSSSPSPFPSSSSNTTTTRFKIDPASPASLRAYFLFHHHGLSITDTASLLRNPPLAKVTVASYILEAARLEGLELDAERARECEECYEAKGARRWKARS